MEKVYTVEDVRGILNVSDTTVLRMLRTGELKGFRLGTRNWRIAESALEDFLRKKERETACDINEAAAYMSMDVDSYDAVREDIRREEIAGTEWDAWVESQNGLRQHITDWGYSYITPAARAAMAVPDTQQDLARFREDGFEMWDKDQQGNRLIPVKVLMNHHALGEDKDYTRPEGYLLEGSAARQRQNMRTIRAIDPSSSGKGSWMTRWAGLDGQQGSIWTHFQTMSGQDPRVYTYIMADDDPAVVCEDGDGEVGVFLKCVNTLEGIPETTEEPGNWVYIPIDEAETDQWIERHFPANC